MGHKKEIIESAFCFHDQNSFKLKPSETIYISTIKIANLLTTLDDPERFVTKIREGKFQKL